jgi:hypothetical protein
MNEKIRLLVEGYEQENHSNHWGIKWYRQSNRVAFPKERPECRGNDAFTRIRK